MSRNKGDFYANWCVIKCESKSYLLPPKVFWQYFSNKWKLFLKCFTYSLNVHTYAKSPNVIELSLTLIKSCHIKRDHVVMFLHFANKRRKLRYVCNSSVWLISTLFGMIMQNVFLKCAAVKNFNFQNPRWRTAAILTTEKSLYLMMVFPKHRQKCCQKTLGGGKICAVVRSTIVGLFEHY